MIFFRVSDSNKLSYFSSGHVLSRRSAFDHCIHEGVLRSCRVERSLKQVCMIRLGNLFRNRAGLASEIANKLD